MNVFQEIGADIQKAWQAIESEAVALWSDIFKPAITAFTAQELTTLKGLVGQVLPDIERGDLAGLETAVLNAAAQAGVTFLADVQSDVLQPALALIAHSVGWKA